MQRLSGTDALLLSMETPSWHGHVGGLVILDPTDAPAFGGFEAVGDLLGRRLDRVPKYRMKLKEVPLHLDRPVWVDDPHFDIGRHVRRIAVPPPGGAREMGELFGYLMSHQLDRRIPLWETWYVDGVAGGQVGVIAKYHHCLMDGVSGASLADQLLDLEPNPPARAEPEVVWNPAVHGPTNLELFARSLLHSAWAPVRVGDYALRMMRRAVTMASYLRGEDALPMHAPAIPFMGELGPRRAVAFASVGLDDVKRVRRELGVKVNDVVMALCAGGLMAALGDLDALPVGSLATMMALSTRQPGDTEQTNRMSTMPVSLATDVVDPVERVRAIHRSSQSAKAMSDAVRATAIRSMGEVAPPILLNLAFRAIWASHLFSRVPMPVHTIVSNVAGPPVPLYMAGAKVTAIYAAAVLSGAGATNFTVLSNQDRIDFGLTVDPDLVADPWRITGAIPETLAEIMAAAGLGTPKPIRDPFTAQNERGTAQPGRRARQTPTSAARQTHPQVNVMSPADGSL